MEGEDINQVEDDSENEKIDDENIIYQITSFGADYLVDGLVSRIERGDIYRPDFQRQFVWSVPQASRFIESILLGLPIPGIFLYREEDTQKHLIIDGLQRLTTLHSFQKGKLPNSSRVFKLTNVKEQFENKSLDELDPADQRRFQDTAIHATIIQQALPDGDSSPVYQIFDRLNSGGTPLQPQEIRAAIFHGPFQELIESLNELEAWRLIFGEVNKRAKDQELILRFLALLSERENYVAPMKGFLNDFMSANRKLSADKAAQFRSIFERTCELVASELGARPFRPVRALNVAVFDSVMVAIAELIKSADNGADLPENLSAKYAALLLDEEYTPVVSRSTADEKNVQKRIELAMNYMS